MINSKFKFINYFLFFKSILKFQFIKLKKNYFTKVENQNLII